MDHHLSSPRGGPIVWVPYVRGMLHPQVVAALGRAALPWVMTELLAADPFAYGGFIRARWREGRGFLILEHDTVPPDGALGQLVRCPRRWCIVPHPCDGVVATDSLGLAKFGAELLAELPDLADRQLAVWWRVEWRYHVPAPPNLAPQPADSRTHGAPRAWDSGHTARYGSWPGPGWPTTSPWQRVAADLASGLAARGIRPHIHEGETRHLHQYGQAAGVTVS